MRRVRNSKSHSADIIIGVSRLKGGGWRSQNRGILVWKRQPAVLTPPRLAAITAESRSGLAFPVVESDLLTLAAEWQGTRANRAADSAHPHASHGPAQNGMAGRNRNVSCRTRERPYPDGAHPARRREVERALPNEYRWTGNG